MRKKTYVLIFLFLILSLCSCTLQWKQVVREQKYDEGYEDIQRQIVQKYGEQVYVSFGKDDKSLGIYLEVKSSYHQDIKTLSEIPYYMIVEDTRIMINEYLDSNPDSQLSVDMKNTNVYLEMLYEGDHIEFLYLVKPSNERLNIYENVSGDELDDMYDYIAKSGDVKQIKIVDKYGLSDEEQEKWREEVRSKFPLMISDNNQ